VDDDNTGFKRDSSWNPWNYSEEDPTITVLLLGEPVAGHWPAWVTPPDGLKLVVIRGVLKAVVQDIGDHGVIHANISAWNILRFTGEDTPVESY